MQKEHAAREGKVEPGALEQRVLMCFKPKMFHVLALVLALSVIHSAIFLAHFTGLASDVSPWMFGLNAALAVLFIASFLYLLNLSRHVYEISEQSVTELDGLVYRKKRTIPLDKIFGYRMNRSPLDLVLGTAHLTIFWSSGATALEVTAAGYADARNAEVLLGRLLSHKDAPARGKVAAGI